MLTHRNVHAHLERGTACPKTLGSAQFKQFFGTPQSNFDQIETSSFRMKPSLFYRSFRPDL